MEYSIVKGNKVLTRIVATKAFADKQAKQMGGVAVSAAGAQMGFEKSGSKWADKRPKLPTQPRVKSLTEKLLEKLVDKGVLTASDVAQL